MDDRNTSASQEPALSDPSGIEHSVLVSTLFDHLPEGILIETCDGRVAQVNPAFCDLLAPGLAPGELIGRQASACARIVSKRAKDPDAFLARIEALTAGGERAIEEEIDLADGTALLRSFVPLRDPERGLVAFLWQYRDITEARAAEQRLRESEHHFRQLFDNSSDALFLHDEHGRFVEVNRRACESLGYARQELLGMTVPEIEMNFEPAAVAEAWETMEPGDAITIPGLHRRKDGSTFPVDVRVSLFELGDRKVMLASVRDLSERRALEEQLTQAQKMEAVGRLAGGVAHDFNNVLTVILGSTGILRQEIPSSEPLRSEVDDIEAAARRASELTRDLLAFSRQQVLAPRVVDPAEVVRRIETLVRRILEEDVRITLDLADGVSFVRVDPGKLEQALLNLAINARDAMEEGGTFTIELRERELAAPLPAPGPDSERIDPGRYVEILVSDTGSGMEPGVQAKIFEPFFSTKEGDKGSGLGLAMVYGFVKQTGGHVAVESTPGKGTTFSIFLPAVDAAEGAVEEAQEEGGAIRSASGETILIVEDEDTVRSVLRRILVRHGFRVLEAVHGKEALEVLEREGKGIDLLVTDAVMPEMGGLEFLRRVRGRGYGMPMVLVSGYSEEIVRAGGEGAGAGVRFLEKPFTVEGVVRTVLEALDGGLREDPGGDPPEGQA